MVFLIFKLFVGIRVVRHQCAVVNVGGEFPIANHIERDIPHHNTCEITHLGKITYVLTLKP